MTQATELRELATLLKVDSGNVGIGLGTDTPDQPLHIKGTRPIRIERAGVGEFEISIDNTVTGDSLDFVIEPVSGSVSAGFQVRTRQTDGTLLSSLSVNHDGKVGIGTIIQDIELDVEGGSNVFDIARFGSSASDNSEVTIGYFDANANNGIPAVITASDFGGLIQGGENGHLVLGIRDNDATDALDIVSGGGNFMSDSTYDTLVATFKANGNVGIGINNPSSLLTVHSSTAPKITISNGGGTSPNPELEFFRQSGVAARIVYEVANKDLVIKNDSTLGNIQFKQGSVTQVEIDGTTGTVDIANDLLTNNAKLKALAKDITTTAVDVFVYDTRKDSDGGAWRKRTQHTSWYSEASDSRRGTRKDFPSVAVLVAHSTGVTIYDGDDPDMPMWMYIFAGYSHNFSIGFGQGGNLTAVTARDGVIYTTTDSGTQDASVNALFAHNFVSDRMYQWNFNEGFGYYPLPIEGRDSGGNLAYHGTNVYWDATKKLNSLYLNDVSVTVLPNAPIDYDTGLPVPTIAVATDSGINIINNDGTIASRTEGHATMDTSNIDFMGKGSAYTYIHSWGGAGHDGRVVFVKDGNEKSTVSLPYAKSDSDYADFETAIPDARFVATALTANRFFARNPVGGGVYDGPTAIAKSVVGGYTGITNFDSDHDLINYITTDFNTGWQGANSRLAALSDTDTTNVTGAELVPNGDFASGTTSWSAFNGQTTISESSGQLTIASSGSDYGVATCALSSGLVEGKKYTFSFNLISMGGTTVYYTRIGTAASGSGNAPTTDLVTTGGITATGRHSVTFTATAAQALATHLVVGSRNDGTSQVFDDFSLRLAEEDRSYWNRGLQIRGTITKTAVETGAELVGYSGFSTTNYLSQPYNDRLNFGTGDFSYTTWFKCTTAGGGQYWFKRGDNTGGNAGLTIWTAADLQYIAVYINGSGLSTPTGSYELGRWNQCVISRTNGTITMYVNNKVVKTGYNAFSIPTAQEPGLIGYSASTSSLSLSRMSASSMTAKQVSKMYHDEKPLFVSERKSNSLRSISCSLSSRTR